MKFKEELLYDPLSNIFICELKGGRFALIYTDSDIDYQVMGLVTRSLFSLSRGKNWNKEKAPTKIVEKAKNIIENHPEKLRKADQLTFPDDIEQEERRRIKNL